MAIRLLQAFFGSIMGPRLYRIYHRAQSANPGDQLYQGNFAESIGDFSISYLVPSGLIFCIWQRRLQYVMYLGILFISSYMIRAVGRAVSPSYQTFLQILGRSHKSFNTENAELLRRYDFDFTSWPVSYRSEIIANFPMQSSSTTGRDVGVQSTICWIVGWVVAHTFGIRLIYPGLIFQGLLKTPIQEARAKYVMQNNGVRTRIQASDGNTIDTMFFDRRSEINPRGKTLVICFEGNAGFYEIGMMVTPLEAGYSILGWNHPGFGGSTGAPYPKAELNAAEAVLDYATSALGFKEEEIVLYAWSIGGFPAAYIASSHPKVKAVVLDATFDDVLPLAIPRMPAILSPIVHSTIRNHVDLRVAKLLDGYPGPLRLIRRTEDEIIADPPNMLSANRGNNLLVHIMKKRYPTLINANTESVLLDWLSKPHITDPNMLGHSSAIEIPDNVSNLSDIEKSRLLVSIAANIMTDFKSSHCIALPSSMFQMPWPGPVSQSQPSSASSSQQKLGLEEPNF